MLNREVPQSSPVQMNTEQIYKQYNGWQNQTTAKYETMTTLNSNQYSA